MPGAHKIGAAISGPRITGGNFMDTTLFLRLGVLPGVPSHRVLNSYFLWILAERVLLSDLLE